jgi:4-amino-4-deoxy-L-arabinose transferase-like glycosyltransferase
VWRSQALVALCVITFFVGIGQPAISDSDEAFYAESAREMVASGDWITPHFNYEPRFQKPILFYWLAASGYVVAGVGEAPARFFAALSGLGLAWIAFACGRRWYGTDPGLLSGAVVATCYGAFAMARQSLPDLPTAFFISLGTWAAIEATGVGPSSDRETDPAWLPRSPRAWLLLASAAMGCGMLTKGPIAVALPMAVVVPVALWERVAKRKQTGTEAFPLHGVDLALAAGLFLLIASPWYLAVTWVHGPSYLYQFFVGENLQRFATTTYNEPRGLWYYVPVLLGGLLPWSPLMLLWIAPAWRLLRRRRNLTRAEVRLGIWTLVPLLLLSVSVGKQPRYILPCLVPIAVLIGQTLWAWSRVEQAAQRRAAFRLVSGLTGVVLVAIGVLIWRAGPLFSAVSDDWSRVAPASILAAGLFVLLEAFFGALRRIPFVMIAASAVMLFVVQHSVLAVGQPEAVQAVAQAARAYDPAASVFTCGAFTRNLVFYTRTRTSSCGSQDDVRRILGAPERVLAVVDAQMLDELESSGRRFRRLAEARYLNTGQLRLGTFLHPDPSRDLQRVVLISNR